MTKEYGITKGAASMDLLNIFENLRDDARDEAYPLAMRNTQNPDPEARAKAMYYLGQVDLITTLLWALNGTAERDGCEPTLRIADNC